MKTLLIASMVFGGGSAVAMQNETVSNKVNDSASHFMVKVRNMFKGNHMESVRENGLKYPSEEYLASLTEEQAIALTSAIDVLNASYDWTNMTDEEIQIALENVKTELEALYAELGIEGPLFAYCNDRMEFRGFRNMGLYLEENGLPYPNENFLATLSEEQATALTSAIDTYNATYDWANMTDEEIQVALDTIRTEMQALHTELGIDFPAPNNFEGHQGRHGGNNKGQRGDRFRDGSCLDDDSTTVEPDPGDAV
ncbi:MAG: hypothetical protein JXR62_02205 [Bacilli bacterium]|nr:hypothetical protein [Bacilli bacterium]